VPISKLNFGDDFWLQANNASIHKSAKVSDFMIKSGIQVLSCPSRSPYLNIVKDTWKIISDQVYHGS